MGKPDLVGKKVGKRTVLAFKGTKRRNHHSRWEDRLWEVEEPDGSRKVVRESNLLIRKYRQFRPNYYLYELIRKRKEVREGLVEFTLTPDDIVIPPACPIRGELLTMGRDGLKGPNSPTAVRIDTDQGWVPGNVKVISWKAYEDLPWLEDDERTCVFNRAPVTPLGPLALAPSPEELCILVEEGWDQAKDPIGSAESLQTAQFAVRGSLPPLCLLQVLGLRETSPRKFHVQPRKDKSLPPPKELPLLTFETMCNTAQKLGMTLKAIQRGFLLDGRPLRTLEAVRTELTLELESRFPELLKP